MEPGTPFTSASGSEQRTEEHDMKTAFRWVVMSVVGLATAAPYAANAWSPASNGVGDGEANVPFANTLASGADETGGGSVAPGQSRGDGARRVAGRAGRATGRRAYQEAPTDAAVKTEDDRAFEQQVWTAP